MNTELNIAAENTAQIHRLVGQAPSAIDAETLQAWIDETAVLLIDVREPHEFERERIAGAFLVPLSRFDVATFPQVRGLRTVLVSEQGGRSQAVAEHLADSGHLDVYALEGGLAAWREAGFELDE